MTIQLHYREDVRHVPYGVPDKSPDAKTEKERIETALWVATRFGGYDSVDNLKFTIDRMVRALLDESGYAAFVKAYNNDGEGFEAFEWETGTAPDA
jgi:hypothetical protein